MSWTIEVKPTAEKYYRRLGANDRRRVIEALSEIQDCADPLSHRDVRPLTGRLRGDYRVRVGKWRILFTPDSKTNTIYVYAILPRGDAY